jgi:hypothetical protein
MHRRYFEKEGGTFINMGLAARDEGNGLPAEEETFPLHVSENALSIFPQEAVDC